MGKLQLQDTAHDNKSCQDSCDVQRASNVDACACSEAVRLYRERMEDQLRKSFISDTVNIPNTTSF